MITVSAAKTVSVTLTAREIGAKIANDCSISEIKEIINSIYSNSIYCDKEAVAKAIQDISDRLNPKPYIYPSFRGKVFVLTGRFTRNKTYWQNYITSRGGKVNNSVSDYVDYLVIEQGKPNGTLSVKAKSALTKGIKIIDTNELQRL